MSVVLHLHDLEASQLRELLTQTACAGSVQSRLIQRIDVAIEEEKRDRFAGSRRVVREHHRPRYRTRPEVTHA